jgi:cell wall-associated NlpC family hydrolase
VYNGPVFELTPSGLVPFTPPTPANSSSNTLAGGTTASVSSVSLPILPELEVPGANAEEIQLDGLELAAAPESAPPVVQQIIWTANEIIGRPYVFGGGHKSFKSYGYDCSGLVSFALHGGDLLGAPLDSGQFMRWGGRGQGQWMTILTNPGHAYLDVAGLRLDTSPADDPSGLEGSRWRPLRPGNPGFVKRHPIGL